MQANHHYALIISVAAYQYINPLSEAVSRDALAIKDLLLSPDYCAYPERNVRLLQDQEATAKAIRDSFHWLAENTDKNSVITIYFSGHGGRLAEGGQQQTYLLPVDAQMSSQQATIHNAISGKEFSRLLRNIPARKLLVIFDCCHSGGIGQPKSAPLPELKQGFSENYYQQLSSGEGRAIVASSLESETSAILFGEDHSLFTKHLLAGLQGAIPSTDGFIRVFELFNYVQQQVKQEAEQNNIQQSPFFQCAIQENFPVALYKSGRKETYTATPLQKDDSGTPLYDFDVYVSYLLQPADNDDLIWVEDKLIPELVQNDLRVASQRDVQVAGVAKLDAEGTGMNHARRTIVIVSRQSLGNELSNFESMMAQYMGLRESRYRVIPVYRETINEMDIPLRLGMLNGVNLASRRTEQEMQRLIKALKEPLP